MSAGTEPADRVGAHVLILDVTPGLGHGDDGVAEGTGDETPSAQHHS